MAIDQKQLDDLNTTFVTAVTKFPEFMRAQLMHQYTDKLAQDGEVAARSWVHALKLSEPA